MLSNDDCHWHLKVKAFLRLDSSVQAQQFVIVTGLFVIKK
jgi:hypothetical protein